MIKFENLKKACDEIGFELISQRRFMNVFDGDGNRVMYFFPNAPWDVNFNESFNFLSGSEKAMILKGLCRDYEEFMHGDE